MKTILREYGKIIWKRKWRFLMLIFFLIIANMTELVAPIFYKNLANALSGGFSMETEKMAITAILGVLAAYMIGWIAWRFFEFIILGVAAGGMRDLSKKVFSILQQQRYEFFQNEFSGSIVKKASRFIANLDKVEDWFLFQCIGNLSLIIGACVVFYFYQPDLAFYFGGFILVFLSFATLYSIFQFQYFGKAAAMDSKISGVFADSFSNIFSVKTAGKEIEEKKIHKKVVEKWEKKTRFAWMLMFIGFGVQAALWIGFEIFLMFEIIEKWKAGNFSVGEFVLFQSIVFFVLARLWEFGRSLRTLFTALADAKEMAEIIDTNDIEKDTEGAEPFEILNGKIVFENIWFGYDMNITNEKNVGAPIYRAQQIHTRADKSVQGHDKSAPLQENNENYLFQNFSLDINPREKIALVGASGSGKTTITKLLFRFYGVQKGEILFDGKNAEDITLQSLRSQISLVPQRAELFHRSIRENLSFAHPNATEEEIFEALKKAKAFDFVENLPDKIDTMVGERGVKLSGGEAQRIAIARAFLENSPIVVLDEATSSLDSITEQEIQAGIFELIQNKTAIVIAHRLSTILQMDRIIVMEHGKILEMGTHEELLAKGKKYSKMWSHQSGNFMGE